jgi:hypothetical protein
LRGLSGNELEKIIQKYIGENLWLLDPSWERAGELPEIEKRLGKYVKNEAGLTKAEKAARLDIKYRRAVGHHVIIELKRPDVKIKTGALIDQINKYRVGTEKILASFGRPDESIEIVCLLGSFPDGWNTGRDRADGENQLRLIGARVLLYDQLIDDAQAVYRAFLDRSKEIGKLRRLLDAIRSS